jgi:hypothetical protein
VKKTVVVPIAFGPFAPGYPKREKRTDLGTNDFVYGLIAGGPSGPNTWPVDSAFPPGYMADVRDIAKAVRSPLLFLL